MEVKIKGRKHSKKFQHLKSLEIWFSLNMFINKLETRLENAQLSRPKEGISIER